MATDWTTFRDLDHSRIHADMEKPAFIFDRRNLLDPRHLFEMGFNVYPVGQPAHSRV